MHAAFNRQIITLNFVLTKFKSTGLDWLTPRRSLSFHARLRAYSVFPVSDPHNYRRNCWGGIVYPGSIDKRGLAEHR